MLHYFTTQLMFDAFKTRISTLPFAETLK